MAPGAPEAPYEIANTAWCYSSFVERPDETLMFSTSLRHVTDGGLTWGDPTIVHQHATETDYAVDANVLDHILAMTRKQRSVLRGEDETAVLRETGGQSAFPLERRTVARID